MTQSAIWYHAGATVAALTAIIWASASEAAPGKLCNATRSWVERHCDKGGRLATTERCTKWLGWLNDRCPADKPTASDTGPNRGNAAVPDERANPSKPDASKERVDHSKVGDERANRSKAAVYKRRSKVRDDKNYGAARYSPPPHRKHVNKVRTRIIYVYVQRPSHRCCHSDLYYRTTPYRDQVFMTDFVLRPGKEAAFYQAHDGYMR
jgi:hypothetical protein